MNTIMLIRLGIVKQKRVMKTPYTHVYIVKAGVYRVMHYFLNYALKQIVSKK